jgi:hypothetical protein
MRRWTLPLLLFALAGCDEGDDAAQPEADAAAGNPFPNGDPADADTYVAGLERQGEDGALTVRLMDALPAPPERGDNEWVLAVYAADVPMDGCEIEVDPRMRAHNNHGTPIVAKVSPVPDAAGHYRASPVNMFMPGLWWVTLRLTCGDTVDVVTYRFWIES